MGALRVARDVLRPFIDGPLEYRLRRYANRMVPPVQLSGAPHLFHACAWKTGSQWARLVLSDPRVLRHCGHAPFIWAHLRDLPNHHEIYSQARRSLLLTCYAKPQDVIASREQPMRGIFVIRDPRVMLASWISSLRFTHRPNAGVLKHRAAMSGMSEAKAQAYATQAFVTEFKPLLDAWLCTGPETFVTRFEDLTGSEGFQIWKAVFLHLKIDVPDDVLSSVLKTYRIDALAIKGSESAADKYAVRGQRRLPKPSDIPEAIEQLAKAYGYPSKCTRPLSLCKETSP